MAFRLDIYSPPASGDSYIIYVYVYVYVYIYISEYQILLFSIDESVYSPLSINNHTTYFTFIIRNLIGQCTQNLARQLHPSRQNMT